MSDLFFLHLRGPIMSFADTGYGQIRESGTFPTRANVIGILAAAMGVERGGEELLDLHRRIRVHIGRIERGSRVVDYQTVLTAGYDDYDPARLRREGMPESNPTLTWRSFHLGAHYIACIETDLETAKASRAALADPVYAGYLGRRSCVPTTPLLPVDASEDHPIAALTAEFERSLQAEGERKLFGYVAELSRTQRIREDGTDIWYDGEISELDTATMVPSDHRAEIISTGFRRDYLSALPRMYVNRSYTHVHVSHPNDETDPLTNREFFDAAP